MVRKEFFMKQKKKIWFYIIGTFLLAFPFHFGYDILPNQVSAIFFPVNESIWEHMKMLFTTFPSRHQKRMVCFVDMFLTHHSNFFTFIFANILYHWRTDDRYDCSNVYCNRNYKMDSISSIRTCAGL